MRLKLRMPAPHGSADPLPRSGPRMRGASAGVLDLLATTFELQMPCVNGSRASVV